MRKESGLAARLNHEYWPWYLIYLPVLPLLLWHAVRRGSLVFFTNVNPAIDMGGFFGEHKSRIQALLPEGSFPITMTVLPGTPPEAVVRRMADASLRLPLIVKPDVGERGDGVIRADSMDQLLAVLATAHRTLLLQELVDHPGEYGLMFAKDPRSRRTELLSITGKRFLAVEGDGTRTVEQLLGDTYRGRNQVVRLRSYKQEMLARVPAPGEELVVEPIGNHCRGTMFLDARHLTTPALCNAVDELLAGAEGINYGRLDVRARTADELRAGRFTVLELNGVTSEPGHIYDPSFSIFQCWSELLRHVRHIPRIARQLEQQGHRPSSLHALIVRCEEHFARRLGLWKTLASWAGPRPTAQG